MLPSLTALQALVVRPVQDAPKCYDNPAAANLQQLVQAALRCAQLTQLCLPMHRPGNASVMPTLTALTALSRLRHFELCATSRQREQWPAVLQGLAALRLEQLQVLKLQRVCIDGALGGDGQAFSCLRDMSQLRHISLRECRMRSDIMHEFVVGLAAATGLRCVELRCSNVTDAGLLALADAMLSRHRAVQRVDLRGNKCTPGGEHIRVFCMLLESLPSRPSVLGFEARKTANTSAKSCDVVRRDSGDTSDDEGSVCNTAIAQNSKLQ
jgi:hypothetical protein